LRSAYDHPEVIDDYLETECSAGRIKGPFSRHEVPLLHCSPIGCILKKDLVSFRIIHHLSDPPGSSINDFIDKQQYSLAYATVDNAIEIIQELGQGCFLTKTDIASAFRIIPVAENEHHLLGILWRGQRYHDTVLAMGLRSAPWIFNELSALIEFVARSKLGIHHILHILDDYLMGHKEANGANEALHKFTTLCEDIGIPIKWSKTVSASTCITFAGIELDTINLEARLPQCKLENYKQRLLDFEIRTKVRLQELQSIIGILQYTCKVIRAGRPYLRRLYDLTVKVKKNHHFVRLSREVREDLAMWKVFLDQFNGITLFPDRKWRSFPSICLYTDSSKLGFGTILNSTNCL
jgi:hypothetical protein